MYSDLYVKQKQASNLKLRKRKKDCLKYFYGQ
jgi:hypothetical protein